MVSGRRKHPPHLVVAPLGQRQGCGLRAGHLQAGGQAGLVLPAQDQRAGGKQRRLVAFQGPREGRLIGFRQVGLGRDQPVQQRAVIGEKEKAGRLRVQPADGRDLGVALLVAGRQQLIDKAALIGVRAGEAGRLVQHQHHAVRRIDRFAVKPQVLALTGHAPVADGDGHFLARAIAKPGEMFRELERVPHFWRFGRSARMIL